MYSVTSQACAFSRYFTVLFFWDLTNVSTKFTFFKVLFWFPEETFSHQVLHYVHQLFDIFVFLLWCWADGVQWIYQSFSFVKNSCLLRLEMRLRRAVKVNRNSYFTGCYMSFGATTFTLYVSWPFLSYYNTTSILHCICQIKLTLLQKLVQQSHHNRGQWQTLHIIHRYPNAQMYYVYLACSHWCTHIYFLVLGRGYLTPLTRTASSCS